MSVALIYAFTFSLAKIVMPQYLQGFGFIVLRVLGAAILFTIAAVFGSYKNVDWKKHGKLFFTCSVFGVAVNMLMFFKGLEITNAINGAVLMLGTPIFVLIINSLIHKQKIKNFEIIGILTACIGAALLMMGKNFSFNRATLPGDILILLNAISYAYYLIKVKELLKHYHVITVSKYTFGIGSLLVLPFGLPELSNTSFQFPLSIWLIILFIIVFTTFITYLLNAWAINKVGPTLVGAYIYLQPILAALIAVVLKTDTLNLQKIIATVLVFTGVFITSKAAQWQQLKA